MAELPKHYNPQETEDATYARWEESGYFNPDNLVKDGIADKDAEAFSIVLPPPNVTGTLHMGHAAMLAIEDTLVRYHRMRGKRTLWVPGTDHAAIATQTKVEKELYKKEGSTRHDLGREEFVKRVEAFAQESHDTIVNQVRKMGSSVDWSREAYTLDEARNVAVRTAFKKMYDDGLIYRGRRIVNWDPRMQTTISDDEIEWREERTNFYYLRYGPFTIATARPETKFGDKYVVMHPDDKRYKEYQSGQKLTLEWINGPVEATVIKDEAIDMELGTGVMTITPWHDATDFDIAERHNLDAEQIIDENGKLLSIAGELAGMHIKKARPLIVEKLKEKGLLERVDENYIHRIATNSRGGELIEPQIKQQWFVDVNKKFTLPTSNLKDIADGAEVTLKKVMQMAVKSGQIEILPDRFEKIYFHWIDNLRDWNISRQLWYGHRIPVYYCTRGNSEARSSNFETGCQKPIVSIEELNECPNCKGPLEQDPDTLDTWFSSGLWTFSTLGWPEQTADLDVYHPTNLLETGYDILFFWVARMILMSGYLLGDIPFSTVYLHGLVRDEAGRKMSKSLDNIIDPLTLIEKYGADATRLSLIIGAAPGSDVKLSEDKVRGYKNFTNKLWNISRFLLMNMEDYDPGAAVSFSKDDRAILDEFEKLAEEITKDIEAYRLYLAAEKLYHYAWHTFADTILEASKPVLQDEAARAARQHVLATTWKNTLKLLHPFVPFVTEELWRTMPGDKRDLLMVETWPHQPHA
ncbi:MAG: valine--tRNA ligase [Candidatus Spechtbacterales bacterium]